MVLTSIHVSKDAFSISVKGFVVLFQGRGFSCVSLDVGVWVSHNQKGANKHRVSLVSQRIVEKSFFLFLLLEIYVVFNGLFQCYHSKGANIY